MDFIRGQNTPHIFSKYDFGSFKLPGLSRNGPLVTRARHTKKSAPVGQLTNNTSSLTTFITSAAVSPFPLASVPAIPSLKRSSNVNMAESRNWNKVCKVGVRNSRSVTGLARRMAQRERATMIASKGYERRVLNVLSFNMSESFLNQRLSYMYIDALICLMCSLLRKQPNVEWARSFAQWPLSLYFADRPHFVLLWVDCKRQGQTEDGERERMG